MLKLAVIFIVAAAVSLAQDEPRTGLISGIVKNSATGEPIPGLPVRLRRLQLVADTGTDGRYTLENVPAGRHSLHAGSPVGVDLAYGHRTVALRAGENLRSIDFELFPNESISGKVVDQDGEPLPGWEVFLVGREHFQGRLHYYRRASARTDDRGEYRLSYSLPPGTGWLVWAHLVDHNLPPVSGAPADPSLRRPATVPTFHPNAVSPEQATALVLRPGEQREGVDIRMAQSPSYCLEARLDMAGGGEAGFWIQQTQPSFGIGSLGGTSGTPSRGKALPGSKLRLCGLHTGEYLLSAFTGDRNFPDSFGTALISITDRDVRDVAVTAQPRILLPGETVWANEPPEEPVEAEALVLLQSLTRTAAGGIGPIGRARVPGEFTVRTRGSLGDDLTAPLMGDYAVTVRGLSGSLYVKDITYGGASVVETPLALGSAIGDAKLRVILGHDGGIVRVRVANASGDPAASANVVIVPEDVHSPMALAARRVTGQTDQNGLYSPPALAPGPYRAFAADFPTEDRSPETIARLWEARLKATKVEIPPNETVEVSLRLSAN